MLGGEERGEDDNDVLKTFAAPTRSRFGYEGWFGDERREFQGPRAGDFPVQ